jgi:hypothetical protein
LPGENHNVSKAATVSLLTEFVLGSTVAV